ncbi:MAG: lipocalin family protein [Prevotellaceae bacterium]|jgi:hypothetical protein|nr:lipocalin family protein [Prevotellaceae bacterium]
MKKVNLLLVSLLTLVAISVSFSSCDKDDEGNSSSIIGKWTFVSVAWDVQNPTDPDAAAQARASANFGPVFMQGMTYEFKADKTVAMTVPALGQFNTGSYTYDGNHLTIIYTGGDPRDATATVKKGVLTIIQNWLDDEVQSSGFTKFDQIQTFKK